MAGLLGDDEVVESVVVTGRSVASQFRGYWAGMTASELKAVYQEIHALKSLSSAQYIVSLRPYDESGKMAGFKWFKPNFITSLPWLATSCSLSVLDAQSDTIQVGHFQQNFITGNNSNEVQVTFLETGSGHILKGARQIKNLMFNQDGTQALPAEYMMWLSVSLFKRFNREEIAFRSEVLVALQAASVELAANNPDPVEVPLTFIKMYPML